MSDTLDEQLRDILFKAAGGITDMGDKEIAQIKQVFAQNHYWNLEGKTYLKDGEILPLYSGEEWYNKFIAEWKQTHISGHPKRIADISTIQELVNNVLKAAKRASGIDNEPKKSD